MTKLAQLASLIRSKNAGPFMLTFDIMFSDAVDYERVKRAGVLGTEMFARLYGCPADSVRFFVCDNALAFKFSMPRPVFQGELGDGDLQFAPLMEIEVP